MPHGGASLHVQMPHGGASAKVQITNLRNRKAIIAHKLMYFYRICNSSNPYLTAKTATLSYTVHILLSVSLVSHHLSLFKYLHVLEWNHMLLFKSKRRTPDPRADLRQIPDCGEEEGENCPTNTWGVGVPRLGIDRTITN